MRNKFLVKNLMLIMLVVLIIIAPLVLLNNADFLGADSKAEVMISEINTEYKPWFSQIWEPPSGEIESLLFSLQAALGAGVLGYYFGYQRGKNVKGNKKYDIY